MALPNPVVDDPAVASPALPAEHYSPTPLEILENFKFASRKQLEQETLSDYLMHLEKLAQTCNFGDYMDKALRNQFVFGIQNRVIQSRLLEVRDLTLTKAKEIAFGMEMSHRGTDEMHNSRQKSEVQHIEHGANKTKKSFQSSSQASSSQSSGRLSNKQNGGNKRCYRCGDPDHYADKCKHKATICKYCKKAGHLERMCLTKTNEKGTDDARKYFNNFDISPTNIRLVSYCDNDIESSRHPLLGRDWLLALNLDFNRVFQPGTHSVSYCSGKNQSTTNALNNLLTKFSRVFDERVGKIEGIQATLTVRKNTKPVYIKARPVAFAVRSTVDKEIDHFVKEGIWEKVDHS
uniref:CCHC-type domain-containing protein n=1 Tax=Anopheles quadriannulatus TaxID=34691 RepID=A0A182XPY4_ANOQN